MLSPKVRESRFELLSPKVGGSSCCHRRVVGDSSFELLSPTFGDSSFELLSPTFGDSSFEALSPWISDSRFELLSKKGGR